MSQTAISAAVNLAITRAELKGLVQRWRKASPANAHVRSIAAYEALARAMGYPNWCRLSIDLNMRRVTHTYAQVAALLQQSGARAWR